MESLGYQEILNYSQNSKLQVSVNPGGNVVMVPMNQLEPRSPTDSLSQHVTTHIITPEQVCVCVSINQRHLKGIFFSYSKLLVVQNLQVINR